MSEPGTPPDDPETAWLAELAGRKSDAKPNGDTELAGVAGRLVRGRFDAALREIAAEPDQELTRARILAHARTRASRRSLWRVPFSLTGTGLAAAIIGVVIGLWWRTAGPEFAAVTGSESIATPADNKSLEVLPVRRYVIHSRDVPATAQQIEAHLTRAPAAFGLRSLPGGVLQINVERVPTVTEDLSRMAQRLGITLSGGESLELTIQPR